MASAIFSFAIVAVLAVKTGMKRKIFFFLLIICGACVAYSAWETFFADREAISYVERNPAGEADQEVSLQAVVGEDDPIGMEIRIPAAAYTEKEAEEYFNQTIDKLSNLLKGSGIRQNEVNTDISLPETFSDNPVSIEWQSSDPLVLTSSGKLGNVSEDGEEVTLTAVLTLGEYEERFVTVIKVFPRVETDAETLLKNSAEKLNSDSTDGRYYLPEELNGRKVAWYENAADRAGILSVIVLFAAVFLILSRRKKLEKEAEERVRKLKRAYPELVSRILLLSYAGMSIRRTMYRTAEMYRQSAKAGRKVENAEMYREIERVCADMDNGIGETEAYERFGARCADAGYRSLAVLLSRSTARGASGLIETLEQESAAAFEDSKRRARAEGDAAAVKLLLPMALMLVVVMVIVLVPSFLSFTGG